MYKSSWAGDVEGLSITFHNTFRQAAGGDRFADKVRIYALDVCRTNDGELLNDNLVDLYLRSMLGDKHVERGNGVFGVPRGDAGDADDATTAVASSTPRSAGSIDANKVHIFASSFYTKLSERDERPSDISQIIGGCMTAVVLVVADLVGRFVSVTFSWTEVAM
ncbi:hypothetical protein Esi_0251_0019 [Ectocarpus siliculosus]|uniref:Uncharacterized protein n=1 Tax=Ectocarpus siliculosus TaxID=2880 RepID=D7FTK6_ECTSI|nr:hypothetical protein Esi_0251_0019 [Ectocarpus siliculosus]|eukprot:CBJ31397.1 hypothetical protein Esi_0251_0019 [Ectocarpus siliculosus]